jgi:hypothetical protein
MIAAGLIALVTAGHVANGVRVLPRCRRCNKRTVGHAFELCVVCRSRGKR